MRKVIISVVFIFIFSCYLFIPSLDADSKLPSPDSQVTISMDFKDADLKDILKAFSIQSGLNFIASEAVQERKITLYLEHVPLDKAMDKLFKANNLSYELDRDANIFIVKDWGKLQFETVTRVFFFKYATVYSSSLRGEISREMGASTTSTTSSVSTGTTGTSSSNLGSQQEESGITQVVRKLLSENGSVIEDFRTNSLIVIDVPSRMLTITQTIAALDVPVPQIMLEVEMLDVSKNTVDKMGLKFGQTPITLNTIWQGASVPSSKFPFGSFINPSKSLTDGLFGINTGADKSPVSTYSIMLDFLKTQTDTKYLARPRILTLNNQTAEIKITTQETVGVTTSTTTTEGTAQTQQGEPERVETGVSLRVTPQVNLDTGEITMFIIPTVKDTSTSTFLIQGSSSQFFKDPEERSTKSVVRIKDGETVIIGGLIRNENVETITKLPLLGDIPVLGAFFRHKDRSKGRERELLVFITPHIIKEPGIKLAQAKKVMLTEREQDAVSGVSRGFEISTSLDTLEKKKR